MYYSNIDQFKAANGYGLENVWYPRVTSIVSIKAKPALYRYYAELASFDEGEAIKKQSADEGTLVHNAIEDILLGKSPSTNPAVKPAVDAFLKFNEDCRIIANPEWVEHKVVNRDDRYAGTVDALATINGKFGVLDIKTSQAIYRDYNLQTSAYLVPLQKEMRDLSTRWILRIDQNQKCRKCGATRRVKGGREKIKGFNGRNPGLCDHEWSEIQGEIELQEFPYFINDYQAFLGAKRLWEWENEYWLKQIGYL
ncbi:MAG: hypothetical protein M1586_00475 [Patescibacteria group bacterium]|nr:hypothetical protein [Patescibacteria group bacterium]MCL5261762.1 hypothetical protein [Patescibacteria group bacterium]